MDQMKDGIVNTLLERARSYEEALEFEKAANCFARAWTRTKESMQYSHISSVREYDMHYHNEEFLADWIQDYSLLLLTCYEDTKNIRYLEKRISFVDDISPYLQQDEFIRVNLMTEKAEALFFLDRKAEAFSVLQKEIQKNPAWSTGYMKLAELYEEDGNYETALQVLIEAKNNPEIDDIDEIHYRINMLEDLKNK